MLGDVVVVFVDRGGCRNGNSVACQVSVPPAGQKLEMQPKSVNDRSSLPAKHLDGVIVCRVDAVGGQKVNCFCVVG